MDSLISLEQIEKGLEIKQSIDKILKSYKEDGSINTSIIKTPAEPGDPLTGKPGKPAVTYTLEEYLEIIKKQLDSIIAPSGGSTDDSGGGSGSSGGSGSGSSGGSGGGETIVKILSLKEVSQKIGNLLKNIKLENDDLILVKDDNTTENVSLSTLKYTHPKSGVSTGEYKSVTVDEQGHVVSGKNPKTLKEYGIEDAYTTLQTNTIINQGLAKVIGGAPTQYNTLKKIVDALKTTSTSIQADISTLSKGKQDVVTAVTHDKNQTVGSGAKGVYIAADGKAQPMTYSLNKDVPSNAKFTDTVYTHPTNSGNKHIPSGGSAEQILRWTSDGTAKWSNETKYTVMIGAEAEKDGKEGLVPAPAKGQNNRYLRSDGTWDVIVSPCVQEDCFIRDSDGNLRPNIQSPKEGDPVLFVQDIETNTLKVANRYYWSWQFMYDANGNIVPRSFNS